MRLKLLGSYVDNVTMAETIARVEEIMIAKTPTQHVVINASKINLMKKDQKLAAIVNAAPLINADGASILLAGKLLNTPLKERVTGIDLFVQLLQVNEDKGYRPYFFGATEEVVQTVIKKVKQGYPNLDIAGYRNGYFSEEESPDIAADIRKSGADMVFVAFSSPMKEYWIDTYKEAMGATFVMGVGGSFDILAGKTKRAPEWMQAAHLEWLYRLLQEPRRMFKRYLVGNLTFLGHVLKEKWQLRHG